MSLISIFSNSGHFNGIIRWKFEVLSPMNRTPGIEIMLFKKILISCVGANILRVIDEVATHGGSCVIGFLFLCPYGAHKLYIGDILPAIIRYIRLSNEVYCACTFDAASNSLC